MIAGLKGNTLAIRGVCSMRQKSETHRSVCGTLTVTPKQSGAELEENELMKLLQHPSLNFVFFFFSSFILQQQLVVDCKIMAGSKCPLCSINYASRPV